MTTKTTPIVYDEAAVAAGTIAGTDTNVTGAQWARLLRTASRGVASGMNLTLSTTADTATLSTGYGLWSGFYLDITATHTVSLPAVATAKTYSIGVLYDPANYSTTAGCLTVAVFDKAAITAPSGGLFYTLYEVDRTPSQSLSASTVRNYRYCASASIYIPGGVALPPAAEHTYGTLAISPTKVYQRRGGTGSEVWDVVTDDTGLRSDGFSWSTGSANEWAPDGTRWRLHDGVANVTIRAKRIKGTSTSNSVSGSLTDIAVVQIPSSIKPPMDQLSVPCHATLNGATFGVTAAIKTGATGSWLYLMATAPAVSIRPGDLVFANATYLV